MRCRAMDALTSADTARASGPDAASLPEGMYMIVSIHEALSGLLRADHRI